MSVTLGVVALLAMVVAALQRSGPVLFSAGGPGGLVHPGVTILNPMRDRGPETAAEAVLVALRQGDYGVFSRAVTYDPASLSFREGRERSWPVRRWRLYALEIGRSEAHAAYLVARGPNHDTTKFFIDLHVRDGTWVVTSIGPTY